MFLKNFIMMIYVLNEHWYTLLQNKNIKIHSEIVFFLFHKGSISSKVLKSQQKLKFFDIP